MDSLTLMPEPAPHHHRPEDNIERLLRIVDQLDVPFSKP
jgi:hypothetical protein